MNILSRDILSIYVLQFTLLDMIWIAKKNSLQRILPLKTYYNLNYSRYEIWSDTFQAVTAQKCSSDLVDLPYRT